MRVISRLAAADPLGGRSAGVEGVGALDMDWFA